MNCPPRGTFGGKFTGQKAFLMELDALYCDVIVQRWEEFTDREARARAAKET